MLETLFKNNEKIKCNIVSQKFNGDNKVELIKLDKNLSLKNIINVLTEANKFIDTIIETDVLRKYNINLINYQEPIVQQPIQVQQVQQPIQVQQVQQPIQQEEPIQENLSEELQFYKWLNNNVMYTIGNILIWKELMFKLMNRQIGCGVSSKFKMYFENWCKIKYPNVNNINYIEVQMVEYMDIDN